MEANLGVVIALLMEYGFHIDNSGEGYISIGFSSGGQEECHYPPHLDSIPTSDTLSS
jgi:hypothetical protein